ncbi:unnamed protein product, partial [Didymodactylos carnosus]
MQQNDYMQQQHQFLHQWFKNEREYENKRILTINNMDELQYLCVKPDDIIILQAQNGKPIKVIANNKQTDDLQTKQQHHQFHPQHHQTSYDQYPLTSSVNHELLSSTLENEQLSMWPPGDEQWYKHEMKQQREIFLKATSTRLEAEDDKTSQDITQSQMELMMMRQQVLFKQQQQRLQLEHLELKHRLALVELTLERQQQQSSAVIQQTIIIIDKLNEVVYKQKDSIIDIDQKPGIILRPQAVHQSITISESSDHSVAYPCPSLLTKSGTIGEKLFEHQHIKRKMK